MDRDSMIEGKREALGRYVLMIFAILGIAPDGSVSAMPRRAYFAALALLRPVESALRRLIVTVAQGMAMPEAQPGARQINAGTGNGGGGPSPRFALFDSRKDFGSHGRVHPLHPPRLTVMDGDARRGFLTDGSQGGDLGDALVDAGALGRRVLALDAAWRDVPGQALRLLRLRARRTEMRAAGKMVRCIEPLRPGWPPGYRCRGREPVHELLLECDGMARLALTRGGA